MVPEPAAREEIPASDSPYWISVSQKRGYRRLRRRGGCGVLKSSAPEHVNIYELEPEIADDYCHLWPRSKPPRGWHAEPADSEVRAGDSESSASSSPTFGA